MEPGIKLALASCGMFFLAGLLTGVWKYVCIARSANAQAPTYVDVCHRAALMYSFACLVLSKFVELSVWSPSVDLWATLALVVYFAWAVFFYALHGWLRDTDNQLLRPHIMGRIEIPHGLVALSMWMLVAAEVGGFAVLFTGGLKGLFAT